MKEGLNRCVLLVQTTAWFFGTGLEGGVYQNFRLRCTTPTFLYLPHSAVFIRCESAAPCRTGEKGEDESDPPQKWGGM